jgi:hypothetical protein
MTSDEIFAAARKVADDKHDAELQSHEYVATLPRNTCRCGREFRSPQGLGLHRAAAERKIGSAWMATLRAEAARLVRLDQHEVSERV